MKNFLLRSFFHIIRSPCMLEIVRENTEIKAKQFPRAVKKVSSFVSAVT